MGLASVVPHGGAICIALNFDLRLSSVSTAVQSPRWAGLRFSNSRLSVLHSVSHNCRAICFPAARSRGMEQDDQLSEDEQNSYANSKEKLQENKAYASSAKTVAFWVCSAVAFGVGVGLKEGAGKASEFFAGYLLEQSLSVDNLFVFVLIFKYFKVPHMYQNRVLSYGIAGAIIFRLSLILLGTATLQRFEVVNLLLAAILLFSSFKLFSSEEDDTDLSDNFIVKTCQRFIPFTSNYDGNKFINKRDNVWQATPLLLTVAVIELSDIAFAVDSIPAVFGVTRDPFIVFSSNIFAILGLRSLYTLIAEGMADLEYLQPSIAVVLGFIGFKMILDFFGFHVSTEASLGFVATSLSAGVLLSLAKKGE
ncbi:glutathione S-transferase L3-like [Hibiscus syriacus]|uniref:Glutathione S-transferase L3-like n=1 Tax=Hibiscus syriacus TaxID=106335 RepID=A0A6A3BYW0_HIBSY|nr:thylakoid membrane protein TERC, chloroplastic-like [Hibiscus syriacus]KAE8721876.1 glutathione S-transferase L3-like [Hibiscus syriacus]